MAFDEALLEFASQIGHPVLRFYAWTENAASFGYSQHFSEVSTWTPLRPLIRRPTGGGLAPHDRDWTYSLVFPPGHSWHQLRAVESYRRVHEWIRDAFANLNLPLDLSPRRDQTAPGQCFVGAERFDLLWEGKKIAGAAQRRNQSGQLIQGSVQPPEGIPSRTIWQDAMLNVAAANWDIHWTELELNLFQQCRIAELRSQKYSQPSYNERR